jgi:hypothetical protein
MTLRESYRRMLISMLRLRKDQRYRRGMIQMAVMADVIDQREWEYLERQINERVGEPRLP